MIFLTQESNQYKIIIRNQSDSIPDAFFEEFMKSIENEAQCVKEKGNIYSLSFFF